MQLGRGVDDGAIAPSDDDEDRRIDFQRTDRRAEGTVEAAEPELDQSPPPPVRRLDRTRIVGNRKCRHGHPMRISNFVAYYPDSRLKQKTIIVNYLIRGTYICVSRN